MFDITKGEHLMTSVVNISR